MGSRNPDFTTPWGQMGKETKMKKGKKKVDPRPKASGRSAPRTRKKPLRLEVGKTYESEKGFKIEVRLAPTGDGMFWGVGPEGVWEPDGSLNFTSGITARKYGRLIREVPGAKRPRGASPRGSK